MTGKAARTPTNRKSGDLPSAFRALLPGRGVPGRVVRTAGLEGPVDHMECDLAREQSRRLAIVASARRWTDGRFRRCAGLRHCDC
jgi:hypothetical protein